jgi:hypothetical protein
MILMIMRSWLFALALLGACAMANTRPSVSVLGVTRVAASHEPLRVMVEIHNHSHTPLKLSHLDYTFEAGGRASGSVDLRTHRAPIVIPAERSSVVDIDVPVEVAKDQGQGAQYHLEGTLHGWAGDTEVTFQVTAGGEMSVVTRKSGSSNWGIADRAE